MVLRKGVELGKRWQHVDFLVTEWNWAEVLGVYGLIRNRANSHFEKNKHHVSNQIRWKSTNIN